MSAPPPDARESALKTCPFCGGSATTETFDDSPETYAWCPLDGCPGLGCASTVEQWNRRAPTRACSEPTLSLQACLDAFNEAARTYSGHYRKDTILDGVTAVHALFSSPRASPPSVAREFVEAADRLRHAAMRMWAQSVKLDAAGEPEFIDAAAAYDALRPAATGEDANADQA